MTTPPEQRGGESAAVATGEGQVLIGSSAMSASRVTEVALVLSLTNEYTVKLRELCLRARSRNEVTVIIFSVAALLPVVVGLFVVGKSETMLTLSVTLFGMWFAAGIVLQLRQRSQYRFQVDVAARVLERIVRRASELYEHEALTSAERLELDIRLGEAEGTLALARARRPSASELATREHYYDDYLRSRSDKKTSPSPTTRPSPR